MQTSHIHHLSFLCREKLKEEAEQRRRDKANAVRERAEQRARVLLQQEEEEREIRRLEALAEQEHLAREEAMKIKCGQCLRVNEIKNFSNFISNYPNYSEIESLYCTFNNIPIALLKINKNMIRPSKVFNV